MNDELLTARLQKMGFDVYQDAAGLWNVEHKDSGFWGNGESIEKAARISLFDMLDRIQEIKVIKARLSTAMKGVWTKEPEVKK